MNWRQAALAAAGTIAMSAHTASADGWRLALPMTATTVNDAFGQSPFYGGVSYEHQWRGYGRFQFGTITPTGTQPLFDRWVHGESKQPGFHIGMRLPDSWAPPWAGRNLRVEFSGAGSLFSDTRQSSFTRQFGNSRFLTVGTGVSLTTAGNSGFDFQASIHSLEGAIRIAGDFDLAPGLTLTPAFAVLGGTSHSRYRLVLLDACNNATAPCFQDTVKERVWAQEYGGTFSLAARYDPNVGISLYLGGGVSVVHTHATLSATDCFDASSVVDGCQASTGLAAPTSATATLSKWGYRLFGQGGVGFQIGAAKVDLLGGVRWMSVVPEVRSPLSPGQQASLGSRSQIGYTGQVRLTMPLDFRLF